MKHRYFFLTSYQRARSTPNSKTNEQMAVLRFTRIDMMMLATASANHADKSCEARAADNRPAAAAQPSEQSRDTESLRKYKNRKKKKYKYKM